MLKMKLKSHKFVLTVKTYGSAASAKNAVLSSFAQRRPDNCELYLARFVKPKPEIRTVTVREDYNP